MAVWPIHANDPGKTPEFSATLTEKGQRQIVRSEDNGQKFQKNKSPSAAALIQPRRKPQIETDVS
jgi:hypothetical protein